MKNSSDEIYFNKIACLNENFKVFDEKIKKILQENSTLLDTHFEKYLSCTSSKRIRSALIFLTSLTLFGKVTEKAYKAALAVELLHNASLIHDDIIDCASIRRENPSLNAVFSDKLAVIAGDFLFSLAFKLIVENNSSDCVLSYIETFKKLCLGEIEQYFKKNQIPTMEEYIEKSANKTASLFKIGIESAFRGEVNDSELKKLEEFALNFGIAFQLNNDLKNILNGAKDFNDGIYTAAIIYANEKDKNILQAQNLIAALEKTGAINAVKELISRYVKTSVDNLSFLGDNDYKFTLISICKYPEEF